MDFRIIVGWSVTILAITSLVFLIRIRNKKREKEALAPLRSFAGENNSEITYYNMWDKTYIGVDKKEFSHVFFIRNISGNSIREKIDVSEVADCNMVVSERKVYYNKGTVNVMDRIELVFTFMNHKPQVKLEFYNSDYDQLTLSGELQLAQKWNDMIKRIVQSNKVNVSHNQARVMDKIAVQLD